MLKGKSYLQLVDNLPEEERTSENMLALLEKEIGMMPGGFFKYRAERNSRQEFVYVSDSMLKLLGFSTVEDFKNSCNNSFFEFVYEEDRESAMNDIYSQIRKGSEDYCVYRVRKADGSLMWVFDRGYKATDSNGVDWFYVIILNADSFMRQHIKIEAEHEELQLINRIPGMATWEYYPNRDTLAVRITNSEGEIIGICEDDFLKRLNEISWISKSSVSIIRDNIQKILEVHSSGSFEFEIKVKDELLWYKTTFASITSSRNKLNIIAGLAFSIENYRNEAEQWREKASMDSLTGLYNHAYLLKTIEYHLSENKPGTMLMIDIDGFKAINDNYGHVFGDTILKKYATTMMELFRPSDTIVRYGGDEFAVFVPMMTDHELLDNRTKKLMDTLHNITTPDGNSVNASIGLYVYDGKENISVEDMIVRADKALYTAKNSGKATYSFYK